MAARANLNVSLTPQLEKFIHNNVSTGRYQTASEVVREGLRLLEQQELHRKIALRVLKKKLHRSSVQADRGEFIDPVDVLAKIESAKRRRARGKA